MVPILILDTCVRIAAFHSRAGGSNALLRLVGTGRFDIALTTTLLLECEAVLKRSPGDLGLTAADVTDPIDYLCRVSIPAEVRFRVRPSLLDPNDEMVLEAAVASGATGLAPGTTRRDRPRSPTGGAWPPRPGR